MFGEAPAQRDPYAGIQRLRAALAVAFPVARMYARRGRSAPPQYVEVGA